MAIDARGKLGPSGSLTLKRIPRTPPPAPPTGPLGLRAIIRHAFPRFGLAKGVAAWRLRNLWRLIVPMARIGLAELSGVAYLQGSLWLTVIRKDGSVMPLGLAGLRVVTNAGVDFIVDGFQNTEELETLKYHGIGTGSTAENATDTALVTELTTEYNPDSTRATGSLAEGASSNIFRTVGTNTVDAGASLREHGIFDQAATGGGTLLDRTVFALITLTSGDSLQSTYDLTMAAGS